MPRPFNLTDAERRRVERIDRLVMMGGASAGELLAGLSDASWTVRRAVVAALGALGDDAVVPLVRWLRDQRSPEHAIAAAVDALSASVGTSVNREVIALLDDPRPPIVADAAQILGRRRVADAAPRLTRLLGHPDDNVAVAAIEALGAIGGSHAVDALIEVVQQRSFFRTFPALQVLARATDPRVVAPLATLLGDDTYRIEAARALGRTGHAQAIRPLASLLPHAGEAIVRLVALALADLLERAAWQGSIDHVVQAVRAAVQPFLARLLAALRTADTLESSAIVAVLGHVGDTSVIPELSSLLDDPELRAAATGAIRRITKDQDDALLRALASPNPATRAAVLPVVNTLRAAEAVRALIDDDEAETRAQACETLARIGDTAAVPRLFAALEDDSPRVAHAATAAIQALGVPETAGLTIAALASPSPAARRHALRIVASLGFSEAFDAVRRAVDDPDPRIAELAVGALGVMMDPRVDPVFVQLARDERDGVRAATMRAAGHREGAAGLRLLEAGITDDAAWVRYYACQGLGRIGDHGTTALIVGRMSDAAPHVRIVAIEALGHMATPAAWQALCSAIRSGDTDERRAALASMALHPRDQALPFLIEAATSDDNAMRLIAVSGLARRPEPTALAALAAAAAHGDPELREAALSLLGDRDDPPAATALVDIALATDVDDPAQRTLSQPGTARIGAIAARLVASDERASGILASALVRMRDGHATALLFAALGFDNPAARRTAAGALVGIGADGARAAVARLAREDPDPEVRRSCVAASRDEP